MGTNCHISFYGAFTICVGAGADLTPKGVKAKALLVLLADAPDHKRARRWIESKLWSDRAPKQASGSLRQTLNEIRTSFGNHRDILCGDRTNIWLKVDSVASDLASDRPDDGSARDILEGLDVRDPEFEEWLTAFRQRHGDIKSDNKIPSNQRGINLHCQFLGDQTARERLAGQILVDQIGRNIEDKLTAWRVSDLPVGAAAGDIHVSSEITRDGDVFVVYVRVVHEQTGRVLYSGFRQQPGEAAEILSDQFVTEFGHDAAARSLSKLPQAVGLDRPEAIAAGFANLALRRLYCFDTKQISEADDLMRRAFDADQNGLYPAWRGFIRMAQVIDRLEPAGPEVLEEVDALTRLALELSPDNAQALALTALTRMMLFDDIETGSRLAEAAHASNPGNLLARQSLAVAYSSADNADKAFEISSLCQPALAREDVRHLWDLYHCLVCISTQRFDEALIAAKRASSRCPDFAAPRRQILALSIRAGDFSAARSEVRALERLEPGFSIDQFQRDFAYPVDTLRKAQLLRFSVGQLTD